MTHNACRIISYASAEHSEKLDNLLRETSVTAKGVKEHLGRIQQASEKTVEEHGKDSSEARTHINMHGRPAPSCRLVVRILDAACQDLVRSGSEML